MKKTYIQPKTRLVAADVCDDIMISGSTGGSSLVTDGGNVSEQGGTLEVDAREVNTRNIWEDEW